MANSHSLSVRLLKRMSISGSPWTVKRRSVAPGKSRRAVFELSAQQSFPSGWIRMRIGFKDLIPSGGDAEGLLVSGQVREADGRAAGEPFLMLTGKRAGEFYMFGKLEGGLGRFLSFEVAGGSERIELERFSIRPMTQAEATLRWLVPRMKPFFTDYERARGLMFRLRDMLRDGGAPRLARFVRGKVDEWSAVDEYDRWIKLYDQLSLADRAMIAKRIEGFPSKPLISVLLPVYNVSEKWLRLAIESVRAQLYPNWELCIADDCSSEPHVRKALEEYQAADPRIRVVFREKNGHISAASNSALELARGEFVALLDHDDELSPHALYMVAEELLAHPDTDLIYSDEDKFDGQGRRFQPHFKPDWNPDLFLSYNVVTHLAVFRASIVKEIGGFRVGYEGSQDYDLTLRYVERISASRIRHIPHILYHWRVIPGSAALSPDQKPYALDAGRKALQEHLGRRKVAAEVLPIEGAYYRVKYALPAKPPRVSLVICTRDRLQLLRGAVLGMLEQTDYPDLEVIVVDNQSVEPETLAFFAQIKKDPRVRVVAYDAPFNFSAINNFGVRQATGEVIGLINNDIEVIHPDWLREMVSHAIRPEVGAVGAKLYYPDDTVQHAGVVLGLGEVAGRSHGVAGHSHKRFGRDSQGYMNRLSVIQDFSAVTAACVVLRRSVFDEVGGLDEVNLQVAFNDVDFCLKIREKGYRIVYTPYAELYHLESATRGSDDTEANRPRFAKEVYFMLDKWERALANDPAYSPNLSFAREDFSLANPPRALKPWLAPASEERG